MFFTAMLQTQSLSPFSPSDVPVPETRLPLEVFLAVDAELALYLVWSGKASGSPQEELDVWNTRPCLLLPCQIPDRREIKERWMDDNPYSDSLTEPEMFLPLQPLNYAGSNDGWDAHVVFHISSC